MSSIIRYDPEDEPRMRVLAVWDRVLQGNISTDELKRLRSVMDMLHTAAEITLKLAIADSHRAKAFRSLSQQMPGVLVESEADEDESYA